MVQTTPSVGQLSKKRKLRLSILIVFAVIPWLIIGSVLFYNYYYLPNFYSLKIIYSLYVLDHIGSSNSSQGTTFVVFNMNITNSGYNEITIYGWYFFTVNANDLWYGVNEVTSFLGQAGFKPLPSNDTYLFKGNTLSGALCFQIPTPLTQFYPRYYDGAHEQFKTLNIVWIQK